MVATNEPKAKAESSQVGDVIAIKRTLRESESGSGGERWSLGYVTEVTPHGLISQVRPCGSVKALMHTEVGGLIFRIDTHKDAAKLLADRLLPGENKFPSMEALRQAIVKVAELVAKAEASTPTPTPAPEEAEPKVVDPTVAEVKVPPE